MKLIFKILLINLCIVESVYCRDIITISHRINLNKALLIKKMIIQNYLIPKKFIKILKVSRPCQTDSTSRDVLWAICIKDQDEEIDIPILHRKKMNSLITMLKKIN